MGQRAEHSASDPLYKLGRSFESRPSSHPLVASNRLRAIFLALLLRGFFCGPLRFGRGFACCYLVGTRVLVLYWFLDGTLLRKQYESGLRQD